MSSFRCEDLKNGNNRHFRAFNSIARRAFLLGSAAILPLFFAQTAQAQSCTPEVLTQAVSGFEGRDASGNPAGFDAQDLEVGDFIVFDNAVIAGYNPSAAIDVVVEITGINLNSAVPPNSVPSDRITLSGAGALSLSDSRSMSDPYVTFRVLPMRSGTVTSTVASGTQLSFINAEISLQDVDSISRQNTSDVAGFANNNPDSFTVSLNETVPLNFQNGGGPANFTTFTQTPISTNPVSWDGALSGGNLDHTVDLSYPIFTEGEYLHGLTGFSTRSNNRGAVLALCGEIAEPELTTLKTLNSVTPNSDGTTDVSFTINVENTGDQTLTGLNLSDDLDDVFSGAYDAFTPSTAADTSGGVIAQDTTATIVTDNGDPIGSLAANTSFNGGSDINLFNPSNSISLDPDDEISLTFVIKLNPNETGNDVSFVNDINVSMTDEFLLPVISSSSSTPVDVAQAPPAPLPLPPELPPLVPSVCHAVEAEAYLLDGLGIGGEQNYQLASGSNTHDPDVFFGVSGSSEVGYVKNADGSVSYYFDGEAPVVATTSQVDSLSLRNIAAVAGSAADQTDAAEFWRVVARFDGVPGQTYNFDLDNGNAHEFIHYWAEDSSGNVLDSSVGKPNTANGWTYGTGATASTSGPNPITALGTTPISYTIPASSTDGIVYVHAFVLDPQVGWGRLEFSGAPECPAPSLSMTKVADSQGPYLVGDVVTYTYEVTNDGNVAIQNVVITDTHNGSDPAPIPGNETLLTDAAPAGDSTDAAINNSWDVLAPGDTLTFTGTYTITQTDAENL